MMYVSVFCQGHDGLHKRECYHIWAMLNETYWYHIAEFRITCSLGHYTTPIQVSREPDISILHTPKATFQPLLDAICVVGHEMFTTENTTDLTHIPVMDCVQTEMAGKGKVVC